MALAFLIALQAVTVAQGHAQSQSGSDAKPPPTQADERVTLHYRAVELFQAHRYAEAEPVIRRVLILDEQQLGPEDRETLFILSLLGASLEYQSRYADAEPFYRRALDGSDRVFGPDNPDTLVVLSRLGELYVRMGRYSDAETLFRRGFVSREHTLGLDDPATLVSLNDLAVSIDDQGRYSEAAPLYRQALQARERVLGREDPVTMISVNNLASVLQHSGHYGEAEPLFRRALEITERTQGHDARDTLTSVSNLASLYREEGRFIDAEPLYRRALDEGSRVLGPDDPDTLTFANNLGGLYRDLGRYAEAETLYRRTLEARQRILGASHPNTLASVNNLASLYREEGRLADAEPLFVRALQELEHAMGPEHPSTLVAVDNLGQLSVDLGRYEEAEPLLRRASETRERVLGRDHPNTLGSVDSLAWLYEMMGRRADAEALQRRVIAGAERTLGSDHPDYVHFINNLAINLRDQGRRNEAAPLFRQVAERSLRLRGPAHPATLTAEFNLTMLALEQSSTSADAIGPARQLVDGLRKRRQVHASRQDDRAEHDREIGSSAARFALFADAAWANARDDATRTALLPETFIALQDATAGSGDRSVAEQAARRYVSGQNAALAELMRRRVELETEWSRLDADLASNFAGAAADAGARSTALRSQLEAVQTQLDSIDDRLRREAPDYFALIEPTPLDPAAVRNLLHADEMLLLVVPSEFGTHVVAVTHDDIQWRRSSWNAAHVRSAVQRLRWDAGASVSATQEELARLQQEAPATGRARFDRTTAFALYQEIVAPVATMMAGKRRIFIAAGGMLSTLPFSVLVSAAPEGDDGDPTALRNTHWFGDEHALVHIPSVQSLALLRQSSPATGVDGFAGIGNPALAEAQTLRGRGASRGTGGPRQLFRPGRTRDGSLMADVSQLRRMPSLPGTARELEAVRQTLGAPADALMMGANATETNVRRADLTRDRVILFSTHGLTAAESGDLGEAGLVLTPPSEAHEGDDGFLAASEVTTLRLNADWVILSACNTASGDGDDGSGLGPLARAFFFAGARNLLASHWPVSDEVAPILITRTLELERTGVPRDEAFRRALHEIRMDSTHDTATDSWAHPFYWAPFVLIGEGSR